MREILDLTYDVQSNMMTFEAPWHPPVSVDQIGKHDEVGRETRKISFGTHTGTHIDAPAHFIKNGSTIDSIPLERLIGEICIIDLSFLKNNTKVTREMLQNFKTSKKMLFKFGWGKHWNTSLFFKSHPYFSLDAAKYLISQKVELIALDTPSPDDPKSLPRPDVRNQLEDSPIHKTFLSHDVILVEYLANLQTLTDYENWSIIALPLKIKGADGSPARVCIYK
jgi:arylformamidase